MKYGLPRLIQGVVGDLFREDVDYQFQSLLDYRDLDIKTLDLPEVARSFPSSTCLPNARGRAARKLRAAIEAGLIGMYPARFDYRESRHFRAASAALASGGAEAVAGSQI